MKCFSVVSLEASPRSGFALGIIVIVAIIAVGEMPVVANLWDARITIAQNFQRQPQVQLRLGAEKRFVQKADRGRQKITWQTLQGNVVVHRGDVIRYTMSGKNNSDLPVKDLVITQPLPKQTTYVLNSVTVKNNGAKIVYSIDNGRNFVEQPTIQAKLPYGKFQIRPAPAELYTHLRLNFRKLIAPTTVVNATYQVKVR